MLLKFVMCRIQLVMIEDITQKRKKRKNSCKNKGDTFSIDQNAIFVKLLSLYDIFLLYYIRERKCF